MAFAQFRQHTFPPVPPSLSAGGHEMRDFYTAQDAPRPTPNQAPYATPYLGLRSRLSQVWINRWTVLLLLVLARTLIAVTGIDNGIDSARKQALSACTSVESMGSAMASMPHYMSQGVNELAASGVEKAVNGLMSMLLLSVTAVEEVVVFVINMLTQTWICLITLAVSGSLHVALDLIDDISQFLNKTLGGIGDDLGKATDNLQDGINDFLKQLNSIPQLFGVDTKPPTVDFRDEVDRLRNLQLPSGLSEDLDKLNSSIPTFAGVNNMTQTAIRFPFEQVKDLVNNSMVEYQFDRSTFPVPAREQLRFCSDNNSINDFFDDLVRIEKLASKIFIAVIVILAVLACIPMVWREIRRWRMMQDRAQLANKNAYDPVDIVYISSRPYSSSVGIWLGNRFSSTRTQTLIRWMVAYASSTPALFVLSLAVAGLAACLCQYILLKTLQKQVPALSQQVGRFAEEVVYSLNNASEQWAVGTNAAIATTNNNINEEVFGWVKTTTGAVNDTLNTFLDGMHDVLADTFNGTILYEPIRAVLFCLVELKVSSLQGGLTWVSEHAHIDFPRLKNDTFSLGALASITNSTSDDQFLASPNTKAQDDITEALADMVRKIESGIRSEALISTATLIVWVIIVLMGCARAASLIVIRDKTRAEGGRQFYNRSPAKDGSAYHSNHVDKFSSTTPAAPSYEDATGPEPEVIEARSEGLHLPAFALGGPGKLGFAGAREVGDAFNRPSIYRASSHGDLASAAPVENEKTRHS